MRKQNVSHGRIAVMVLALSAALLLSGCGGSKEKKEAVKEQVSAAEAAVEEQVSAAEAAVEETISAAATNAQNEEETDSDVISDEDLTESDELDWDEYDFMDDEEEEVLSPEQIELQEYIDANRTDELLEQYDSLRYEQTMWDEEGNENEMTGYVYLEKNFIYVTYIDGFTEIVTEDNYDGFDPELNLPVRYVFADPTTREDNIEAYMELFYLWGDEAFDGKSETEEKVTFTTKMDDTDFISYLVEETGIEVQDGDYLLRETQFDKASKLMEHSLVKYYHADGTESDLFECKFIPNPENGYEEDNELMEKINSEDTHSLTLTIDPGKEDETVLTATVGKGCAFIPLIYDGYTYFTDKECTLAAEEDELYETEEDVVLYAAFEEIPEEEIDMDDGTYEIEFEEGDSGIDLSELFEDEEEDAGADE